VLAQLLAGRGAKLLPDVVEAHLDLRDSIGRKRGHAGQVPNVDHVDAARPASQQSGRGVQSPVGWR
jgi:hypothetical protein